MDIKEIFELFEQIGSVNFVTVNNEYPESRIAEFLTYDNDGLYFFTMKTKPFYKQLKQTGKLSVCGLSSADSHVEWGEDNMPHNQPGYFVRVSGDVREFTIEDAKAKNNPRFNYLIEDNLRYPTITGFCLYRFQGEVYDYDFEKEKRPYKLERKRFSFAGMDIVPVGLIIDETKCIGCVHVEKSVPLMLFIRVIMYIK